jgi:hypothetical protein
MRFLFPVLLLLHPAAQDARKWAEAVAHYQLNANGRNSAERAGAAEQLGAATAEKFDKQCWMMIAALLRQEMSRDISGKNEERVSAEVLQACVVALSRIKHKDVVAEIMKAARVKNENPRFRIHLMRGLTQAGEPKDFAELMEDKNPLVQAAALDALASRSNPAAMPIFLKVLAENRPWEMKLSALQGLELGGDETAVAPLIESLWKCRASHGRLKAQHVKTLRKITGLDLYTDDFTTWKAAWADKKDGKEVPKGTPVVDPIEFFGLRTPSTRLVFVFDRSASMSQTGFTSPTPAAKSAPPEPPAKESQQETFARAEATAIQKRWAERTEETRMDVQKKEFLLTIYPLSPNVLFNVVWYDAQPTAWRQELAPATWVNKLDCMKAVEKLIPSGASNPWDALELSLRMIESPQQPESIVLDRKANHLTAQNGVDTIYFVADGPPNNGRVLNKELLEGEVIKMAAVRKVTIHAVCLGVPLQGGNANPLEQPDPQFMKRVADATGGQSVHIQR